MSLIVQKYGGTSVGNIECIERVADRVLATCGQSHQVAVVVSAMSGETNRLMELAGKISNRPNPREIDTLLSTGEQVTIALLVMALEKRGQMARSYTGWQIPVLTDSAHTKARIEKIDGAQIGADLAAGYVVVVAGFQGVDQHGNMTTLGRGGSDTTAVALAVALNADECEIYTDVKGVYTTDPRIEPNARLLTQITFEEMLEMASLGSKVLQIRAVEFAGKYSVPLRVRSTFEEDIGTLISVDEEKDVEKALISGIAFNRDEAQLTILGVPDHPGVAADILGPIADANVEVDMIVQNVGNGLTDFTFTVHRNDYDNAYTVLEGVAKKINAREINSDKKIVKISLVGVGMRSHAGIASKMFKILAGENINIRMISTSEIKISVVVEEKYLELAVRALHAGFELQMEPEH